MILQSQIGGRGLNNTKIPIRDRAARKEKPAGASEDVYLTQKWRDNGIWQDNPKHKDLVTTRRAGSDTSISK